MKKVFLMTLALLLITSGIAFAEIAWKSGIGYSIADSKMNFLSTVEVAKWKELTLEAGYAGNAENTQSKAIAVVSYPLVKLKDYIDLPVLNLIECNIGIYGGYGRLTGSNEFDYGISATILNIKF